MGSGSYDDEYPEWGYAGHAGEPADALPPDPMYGDMADDEPVYEGERGFVADEGVVTLGSNSIQVINVQTDIATVRSQQAPAQDAIDLFDTPSTTAPHATHEAGYGHGV